MSVSDLAALLCLGDAHAIEDWEKGAKLLSIPDVVFLSELFLVPIEEILVWDKYDTAIRNGGEQQMNMIVKGA